MTTHEVTDLPLNPAPADFVAKLTVAAYGVALRYAASSTWIDLELDLWQALTEAANTWNLETPFRPDYQHGEHKPRND